ncbi:TetR/AcrR family transcriptional regulator [Candidatus Enterococcus leclercqii]|uniref:TetR/AcrR family transcriptional regulator n=1 Tax=Candidatus Enterococcus leclercqii TaxID=1857218 RepID=UPI00192A3B30|nr:TetR/AcrR family transcriptional regulator [Enterococcus sp. CU9D]KAF1290194.1 TetR family transcriptional regulator [Enterococcus sp. CU9D]
MPPKPVISKKNIIDVAIQLIREDGMKSINARSLASSLNCSTKPLFRIYKNMEELKDEIIIELNRYYDSFMDCRMNQENRLLSQGIAYIEFARQEKNIFSTLFMNRTLEGSSLEDIINADWNRESIENAQKVTGLSLKNTETLFINIWLYSHGVATQIVTNGIDISQEHVSDLLTQAFINFSKSN